MQRWMVPGEKIGCYWLFSPWRSLCCPLCMCGAKLREPFYFLFIQFCQNWLQFSQGHRRGCSEDSLQLIGMNPAKCLKWVCAILCKGLWATPHFFWCRVILSQINQTFYLTVSRAYRFHGRKSLYFKIFLKTGPVTLSGLLLLFCKLKSEALLKYEYKT